MTAASKIQALLIAIIVAALAIGGVSIASEGEHPRHVEYPDYPAAPADQSDAEAALKSAGCQSCHVKTDEATMHPQRSVVLGCTDCHGGDATIRLAEGAAKGSDAYRDAQTRAHVQPTLPETWEARHNEQRTYTLLNKESPEYVRFVNPSDYRVAEEACGACHATIVEKAKRSIMATGAMLWGGASYNNGIVPFKRYILGEAYTREGLPAAIQARFEVTRAQSDMGVMSMAVPLPAWETVPPADIFRIFERGGRNINSFFPETGLPNPEEEPGKPDVRASFRGPGTGNRVSIPVLNVHKTRLNDPNMWFMGTKDQPGDFRSSGCAACHVVYANDREWYSSGSYSKYGNRGQTATEDPTIAELRNAKGEKEWGHPIKHAFSRAIPTSQCMNCHMHQPNMFLNSYLGYTMWDYESDAPLMWPEKQQYPKMDEILEVIERNPEEASYKGKWADVEFLAEVWKDVNPKAKDTQFGDYHGHGWNFRAIFKRSRDGTLLDASGNPVPDDLPTKEKFERAVHMRDIHAEIGMQCADCHFADDAHGNGELHGEVAAEVNIRCRDCHGTADAYATLKTSGPASPREGRDLSRLKNADNRNRFEWRGGKLYQRLLLPPHEEFEVTQVKDTVTPGNPAYNPKAARAKMMSKGTSQSWGRNVAKQDRAHGDDDIACFSCHSSWVTSCGGCHLTIQANWKTETHHYEGKTARNLATYNPQVARDQIFQLGKHGTVKDGIIAPIRSSSALVLSSTDINRNRVYIQQQPVSSGGYSAQAFAPHFPHTVRKTETKTCSDCHVSEANDNNAIMAQLLLLGTNFVNFMGFNAWVGTEHEVAAIQVTEWDEPQAVIGSYLHEYAYPDYYQEHLDRGRELTMQTPGYQDMDAGWIKSLRQTLSRKLPAWTGIRDALYDGEYTHHAGEVNCLQLRGEYLYAAEGEEGMQAFDVSAIGTKGFSERFVTAPWSPLGQDTRIKSENATCVALPTTQLLRPERNRTELSREVNLEQPMHPIYSYAAVTDSEEGLILVNVETLADFEPRNNFFERAITWNPGGILDGANYATFAGHLLYVSTESAVVIVDLDRPLEPKVRATIPMKHPRGSMVQFRYLFVVDEDGLKVVDVTLPERPRVVPGAVVPLADANRVFVSRTYAYVAAGSEGLVIVDVEQPEKPRVHLRYTADGKLNDARDVALATTNASLYAYVADGRNGLKVIQLTSPELNPKFYGFSPVPNPKLIAWRKTADPALAVSRPLERDRAVDETGHQIAVLGRLGSRPFNLEEMRRLYLTAEGRVWTVQD
ncbi:MAG: hypothetical protein H6748_13095 [Spirochaetaceae bacterium]|nr:hypothetical protein [Spirochaetaceae bacterium]